MPGKENVSSSSAFISFVAGFSEFLSILSALR